MGNCGSNPKTNEGPEPVTEEVKVDAKVEETKTEETPKALSTLLNQHVEEAKKTGEAKVESVEVKKAEPNEEKPKTEEVKVEPKEEKPANTEEVKVQEEEKPTTEVEA